VDTIAYLVAFVLLALTWLNLRDMGRLPARRRSRR